MKIQVCAFGGFLYARAGISTILWLVCYQQSPPEGTYMNFHVQKLFYSDKNIFYFPQKLEAFLNVHFGLPLLLLHSAFQSIKD